MALSRFISIFSMIFYIILPWRWSLWQKLGHVIFFPYRKLLKLYKDIEKIDNKLYKLTFNLLGIFVCEMTIFSASIATSVLFYKYYLPHDAVKYPVHFTYQNCESSAILCSYPKLSINFDNFDWIFALSSGQKYNFYLDLSMPDSLSNHKAGMFNIYSTLINKFEKPILTSQKSVMLRYKSSLYSWLSTILNFPFIYLGFCTEDQLMTTRIFDNYQHLSDPVESAHELSITLQSNYINVYEAFIRIEADFIGLRYYMNYYPTLSFISFLSFFFMAFSIVAMIIYYQFIKLKFTDMDFIGAEPVELTNKFKNYEDSKNIGEDQSKQEGFQDDSSLYTFPKIPPTEHDPERSSSSDIETISEASLTESGTQPTLKSAKCVVEDLHGLDRFLEFATNKELCSGTETDSRTDKDSDESGKDVKPDICFHTVSAKLMEGSCSEDDCEIVSVLEQEKTLKEPTS